MAKKIVRPRKGDDPKSEKGKSRFNDKNPLKGSITFEEDVLSPINEDWEVLS